MVGEKLLETALTLPIANEAEGRPAFHARLVFDVDFDPEWLEGRPGLRQVEPEAYYRHFSKLDRRRFRDVTDRVLFWSGTGRSALPALYELELGMLKNARVEGPEGIPEIQLVRADLLPLRGRGGRKRRPGFNAGATTQPLGAAVLGLVFEGGPCSLSDYLRWSSARAGMTAMRLHAPRLAKKGVVPTIGGLVEAVPAALGAGKRLDPARAAAARPSSPAWQLAQYVHLPRDVGWPVSAEWWTQVTEGGKPDPFAVAWWLLASVSRPRKGYPKDPMSVMTWQHARSPDTLYGLHDHGPTVLARGTEDGFNQNTKPTIFLEAHHLQWCVARALAGTQVVPGAAIAGMFTEELRREYMGRCLAFHNALQVAPAPGG